MNPSKDHPRGFSRVRIFGFPITIEPSWFIILSLVTWTLAEGYFPSVLPGGSRGLYWGMGGVGAVFLFASIVLHELSHALVARRFGLKVHRITLFIFGGVAQITEEPPDAVTEFWMAIAGPITSFALAFLAWALGEAFVHGQLWRPLSAVAFYLGAVNLVLGIFNLVPGFPLDGGRVLRAAVWYFTGSLRRATRIASGFGAGFAFLLIGWGAIRFFGGNLIGGGWLVLIGFFLWRASQTGYAQVLLRRLLDGVPVGEVMHSDVVVLSPSTALQEAVEHYFIRYGYHSFPVVSGGRLAGMVSMQEIRRAPRPEWSSRTVEEVMDRDAVRSAVRASDPVLQVFQKLQKESRGRLPVVDEEGRLAGIISRRDIMHLFHLRLDLER